MMIRFPAIVVALMIALTSTGHSAQQQSWRLGQWSPGLHNVQNAIYYAWCGKHYRYCAEGDQAYSVSGCETGHTYSVWSKNGQYLGLFQMGSHERATYGHGNNPWAQALAAHRYYVASGKDWSPWDCKP